MHGTVSLESSNCGVWARLDWSSASDWAISVEEYTDHRMSNLHLLILEKKLFDCKPKIRHLVYDVLHWIIWIYNKITATSCAHVLATSTHVHMAVLSIPCKEEIFKFTLTGYYFKPTLLEKRYN